jgi:hypothetical protein
MIRMAVWLERAAAWLRRAHERGRQLRPIEEYIR